MKKFVTISLFAISMMAWSQNWEAMRLTFCEEVSLMQQGNAEWQHSMQHNGAVLWTDLPHLTGNKSLTPAHVCSSYERLLAMARAWADPASPRYHDNSLLSDVRYGLQVLNSKAFNTRTNPIGNWWEWRIGIPWHYAQIVSLLYDELSTDERQAFCAVCRSMEWEYLHSSRYNPTYANLASACRNLLAIGILSESRSDIEDAIRLSIPAFLDETTPAQREAAIAAHERVIRRQSNAIRSLTCYKQEGLYEDGSFIQHYAVPYIGTYGVEIIELASYYARLLPSEDFPLPSSIATELSKWIIKAYLPAIYEGEMMLMYMGRGNAGGAYYNGRNCALNCSEAAALLPEDEQSYAQQVCADILRSTRRYASLYEGLGSSARMKARIDRAINKGMSGRSTEPYSLVQAAADRVVHQTSSWRVGLAMSSNRIGKYEAFDRATAKQNLTGWYTGDGMTYIYTPADAEQYEYHYMLEANPYRMPGTTVDMIHREPAASGDLVFDHLPKAIQSARAGGVMLDGVYSSAMMQLLGAKSDLEAKKSWYFFDNEVVCLGADINMPEDREVITTVENRRFERPLVVNGTRLQHPQNLFVPDARWAWLEGTGGYCFLPNSSAPSLIANVSELGYTELWFTHGKAPKSAAYSYVLLPMMAQRRVMQYASKPDVDIIRNDARVQAVSERTLGITAMNFWQADVCQGVVADGVLALMMREEGEELHLSVSDPTWDRTQVGITLPGRYQLKEAQPQDAVSLRVLGNRTELIIRTRRRLGMTQTITLVSEKE